MILRNGINRMLWGFGLFFFSMSAVGVTPTQMVEITGYPETMTFSYGTYDAAEAAQLASPWKAARLESEILPKFSKALGRNFANSQELYEFLHSASTSPILKKKALKVVEEAFSSKNVVTRDEEKKNILRWIRSLSGPERDLWLRRAESAFGRQAVEKFMVSRASSLLGKAANVLKVAGDADVVLTALFVYYYMLPKEFIKEAGGNPIQVDKAMFSKGALERGQVKDPKGALIGSQVWEWAHYNEEQTRIRREAQQAVFAQKGIYLYPTSGEGSSK